MVPSMWKKQPPAVGDFEGGQAIYVVRGGPFNYPIPVQVFVGCRLDKSGGGPAQSFLSFTFGDRQIRENLLRDELVMAMEHGHLAGIEWLGPIPLPD